MHRSLPLRSRQIVAAQGFTLIEVLIVMACILIAALALLPVGVQNDATRLRAAASLLVADLEYAQALSIGNEANRCAIVVDPSAGRYHLARQASLANPIEHPVTHTPYRVVFGQGGSHHLAGVTIAADSDTLVAFNALGALDQGNDCVITLHCGSHSMKIRIDSATGYASIE